MAAKKQNEKNAMEIMNAQIEAGAFARLYLLYGEEAYLVHQYRDKLLSAVTDVNDTMNFSRFIGEKPDTIQIIDFCETMPFLAERRVVLVEGSGLFKTSCEEFTDKVSAIPDTAILIFVESEVDKRGRLYKTVAKYGEALAFETPDDRTLAVWIKSQFKANGKQAEDVAIFKLIEVTGSDMIWIKNEIDKLVCYCADRDIITARDVEALCVGNTEGRIFEMIEATSRKQQDRALHLYHELLQNREPAMRILFLLARQFDMMLKTKLCLEEHKSDAQIASIIGVPAWSVKKYREQCQTYNRAELKRILESCQEIDYKIKTGQTTDVIAVELLIVTLSRPVEKR